MPSRFFHKPKSRLRNSVPRNTRDNDAAFRVSKKPKKPLSCLIIPQAFCSIHNAHPRQSFPLWTLKDQVQHHRFPKFRFQLWVDNLSPNANLAGIPQNANGPGRNILQYTISLNT